MQVENAKARGAYYTQEAVADFLVCWATRAPSDHVLDPSFGGGVFLNAAAERIEALGGQPTRQVFGVELDDAEHGRVSKVLGGRWSFNGTLLRSDFFDVVPGAFGPFDAVVGNPPFIRYQRFKGEARTKALARANEQGVSLSRLASAWAPFVIHSVAFVRPGGRLAMVVPAEFGYATYALPVLDFMRRAFGRVTLLSFRKKLFPTLSEETFLLLAEDRGGQPAAICHIDVADAAALGHGALNAAGEDAAALDVDALLQGRARFLERFLPTGCADLYRGLQAGGQVVALREYAEVGIGYVTGANAFFHLSRGAAHEHAIPERFLAPAVLRGRSLKRLRLTKGEWERGLSAGNTAWLLRISPGEPLTDALCRYLAAGEAAGVPLAYKCRVRSPWYSVPGVRRPDAFLSYMSGHAPLLVANEAEAVAPNSLHVVRLRRGGSLTGLALSALWQTSLTHLSAEIEGRALGGGMLKLEPTEAQRTLVAVPTDHERLQALAAELDGLLQSGRASEAQRRADRVVLQEGLGLSEDEVRLLREGAETLRTRRLSR